MDEIGVARSHGMERAHLAALGNGVRGGKWFSLIDKVYRAEKHGAAWKK